MTTAIEAHGLRKRYKDHEALAGVDLSVESGTVFGLLGPNGAGKTTAVRILTTLLRADEGRASVAGFDVVSQSQDVRANIGLTGQYAAVDERLTARENLTLIEQALPARQEGDGHPDRVAARTVRADRRRPPAAEHVLRRYAPPPRPRREPDRLTAAALPRRADHRTRPEQPPGPLGHDP